MIPFPTIEGCTEYNPLLKSGLMEDFTFLLINSSIHRPKQHVSYYHFPITDNWILLTENWIIQFFIYYPGGIPNEF